MGIVTKHYSDKNEPKSMGITGASVGQIAKITAVDGTGKPTAWGPVDMPSSGSGEASDAVLYTEQSLTEEQKAQARENIGGVRPVITLYYSFIGNGFTWNHTATEIQALMVKKYLFTVNGCLANCDFYAGNMRVSWLDGNELRYSDIDDSGKSKEIFFSYIGGILESTTPGSTKKFKITVDDTGALSAVEVT